METMKKTEGRRTGMCNRLRAEAEPIWQAIYRHPFPNEAADGTLPPEKFRHYLQQDFLYLWDFKRTLALAATQATDPDTFDRLTAWIRLVQEGEQKRHLQFADQLDQSLADVQEIEVSPSAYAYRRHMVGVARDGMLAETIAALLPCPWTYRELAQYLTERGIAEHSVYRPWLLSYAEPESLGLERREDALPWLCSLLDGLAASATPDEERRIRWAFLTSARYEYLFWEMAYRVEGWSALAGTCKLN